MAQDMIVWNPRISGVGNDRYIIPDLRRVQYGGTSYSDIPTIAELNAGSDINQVIALIRRRAKIWNAQYGTTLSFPSYMTTAQRRIKNDDLNFLRTTINAVRVAEGASSYSFTPIVSGKKILEDQITELRKALAIYGTYVLPYVTSDVIYVREDNPYLTMISESIAAGSPYLVGKICPGSHATNVFRRRGMTVFAIPSFVADIGDADSLKFRMDLAGFYEDSLEDFQPIEAQLCTNNITTPTVADFHATAPLGTATYVPSGTVDIIGDPSALSGFSGNKLGIIEATSIELHNSGSGNPGGLAETRSGYYDQNELRYLIADFGAAP